MWRKIHFTHLRGLFLSQTALLYLEKFHSGFGRCRNIMIGAAPHQKPRRRVGKDEFSYRYIRRTSAAIGIFELKVEQQMHKNHFDFVGCKEATWTRIFTVSEAQIVSVRRGELMVATLTLLEAFSVVSEAIEFVRVIKMICVVCNAVRGHA